MTTSSSGDRITADIFRIASDGEQRFDLAEYCFDVFAGRENAHEVQRRIQANDDAEAAGDELPYPDVLADLPYAGVIPNADGDVRPCLGTSARLASDPPDPPCQFGEIKAVVGYYYYDLAGRDFVFLSSEDYTAYRDRGGDSGVWDTEYVCLAVIDEDDLTASFDELLVAPAFWKSPHVVGLTGLDTWVWYDFTIPESHTLRRDFTVDADGLPLGVLATIWVDLVRWDMDGDGEWDVEVDLPDSELAPAAHAEYVEVGGSDSEAETAGTWLYETKGTYPVTVEIEWRGIYEFVNYPGNDSFYDPLFASSINDYQVCELRGVLIEEDGPNAVDSCTAP